MSVSVSVIKLSLQGKPFHMQLEMRILFQNVIIKQLVYQLRFSIVKVVCNSYLGRSDISFEV